jgi:anti-sigma factor RsiW
LSCQPERVTALVDDALAGDERDETLRHLVGCEACRAQAEEERALRATLRGLPEPMPPEGFEERARRRLRRDRRPSLLRVARLVLPLAAVLVVGLWLRGSAPVVAWQLSRDHDHCFGQAKLPAQVWSGRPSVVADWFAERGIRLPLLPASAGPLALVGARRCPMPDLSLAPHLYYASAQRQLSVFLVPHGVRMERQFATQSRGNAVALVRLEGSIVGIVAADPDDVEAFVSDLRTSVVELEGRRSSAGAAEVRVAALR